MIAIPRREGISGISKNYFSCRPVTQLGLLTFHNRMSDVDWSFLSLCGVNVEDKCNRFLSELNRAYTVSFPLKKYRVRSDQGRSVNWFTEELRMREHLHFLGELNRQYNCPAVSTSLNNFKKQYHNAIREAKIKSNWSNDNLIASSSNPICSSGILSTVTEGQIKIEQNLIFHQLNSVIIFPR